MNRANHRPRTAVKALAAIAAVLALAGGADLASRHSGATAGAALIGAVFAACWITHRIRPVLRPARPAPVRLPDRSGEGLEPVKSAA